MSAIQPPYSEDMVSSSHHGIARWIYRVEATAIQMCVPGRVSSSYAINATRETNVASATCLTMLGLKSNTAQFSWDREERE